MTRSRKSAGNGVCTQSSTCSSARRGIPAATDPTSGRAVAFGIDRGGMRRPVSSSFTRIARGLVGSRRRYPASVSLERCAWTVEGDARPTASPISRTVGG